MNLSLSEIIRHVGDDNVQVQNILHSSIDIRMGKKEARIAFYTDWGKAADLAKQVGLGRSGEWTALVVWLPTKLLPDTSGLTNSLEPEMLSKTNSA